MYVPVHFSDQLMDRVQKMEKVNLPIGLPAHFTFHHTCLVNIFCQCFKWLFCFLFIWLTKLNPNIPLPDSDKDEGGYCPPVKRERTSSLTQFPPSHSGNKHHLDNPNNQLRSQDFCDVIYCVDHGTCLLRFLFSSQEQCVHALKFLSVTNWELGLGARWGTGGSWLVTFVLCLDLDLSRMHRLCVCACVWGVCMSARSREKA